MFSQFVDLVFCSEVYYNLQLWDGTLVNQLSSLPNVKRVVSLGTLCAIELKAEGSDAGYGTLELESFICFIDCIFEILHDTYFVEEESLPKKTTVHTRRYTHIYF